MKNILAIIFLCVSVSAFSQITVNTNFKVNSSNAIDDRFVIENLADTSNLSFDYAGLNVYVNAEKSFFWYDGVKWDKLLNPVSLITKPDSICIIQIVKGASDTTCIYKADGGSGGGSASLTRLSNYAQFDAFNGTDSVIIVQNQKYGGLFLFDNSASITANNYGIVRQTATGRRYVRQYEGNIRAAWWDLNDDGTTDNASKLQDLADYCKVNDIVTVEFDAFNNVASSYVDWHSSVNDKLSNLLGNGATIRSVNADTDKVMWEFGHNINSTSIEGFNFYGTMANEWDADSLALLKFNDGSFHSVSNCYFQDISGNAVYAFNLNYTNGGNDGIRIESNSFYNVAIDTTGNTSMILFETVEYSSVSNNDCSNCPLFLRGIGITANNTIENNRLSGWNDANNDVGRIFFDRGTIYSESALNFGKYTIANNHINHMRSGLLQIVLNYPDFNSAVHWSNVTNIQGNNFISNGSTGDRFVQVYINNSNTRLTNNLFSARAPSSGANHAVRLAGSTTTIASQNQFASFNNLFLLEGTTKLKWINGDVIRGGIFSLNWGYIDPLSTGEIIFDGDNLGNHEMRLTLNTDNNWISGDGDPEGLMINDDGDIVAPIKFRGALNSTVVEQTVIIQGAAASNNEQDVLLTIDHDNYNFFGRGYAMKVYGDSVKDGDTGDKDSLFQVRVNGDASFPESYVAIGKTEADYPLDVEGDVVRFGNYKFNIDQDLTELDGAWMTYNSTNDEFEAVDYKDVVTLTLPYDEFGRFVDTSEVRFANPLPIGDWEIVGIKYSVHSNSNTFTVKIDNYNATEATLTSSVSVADVDLSANPVDLTGDDLIRLEVSYVGTPTGLPQQLNAQITLRER